MTRTLLALALVLTSVPAHAMARKNFSRIGSAEEWARVSRGLLGQLPRDFNTSIQGGPYRVESKGKSPKAVLVLVTSAPNSPDRCRTATMEWDAALSGGGSPTLRDIGCHQASTVRADVTIPEPAGYATVDAAGRKALSMLGGLTFERRKRAKVTIGGQEVADQEFVNELELRFTPDLRGLFIRSSAQAFSQAGTDGTTPYSTRLLRERRETDGTFEFLVWAERPEFVAQEATLPRIASVEPEILLSPLPLTLSPGRACLGDDCHVRDGSLVRFISFEYAVIRFNPAHPESLTLVMNEVDPSNPSYRIEFTRASTRF